MQQPLEGRLCEEPWGRSRVKALNFISDEITATPIMFAQLPLACTNRCIWIKILKSWWSVTCRRGRIPSFYLPHFIQDLFPAQHAGWCSDKWDGRARVKALRGWCVFTFLFIVKREQGLFFTFKWEHSFSPPVAKPWPSNRSRNRHSLREGKKEMHT